MFFDPETSAIFDPSELNDIENCLIYISNGFISDTDSFNGNDPLNASNYKAPDTAI